MKGGCQISERPSFWGRMARCLLACALLSTTASFALPSDGKAKEMEVKGAFVLKFLAYTDWPTDKHENKESPIVVGVLGKNPFGKTFEGKAAKLKVGSRGVKVRFLEKTEDVATCHVVFVPNGWRGKLSDLSAIAAKAHVLVVGEREDFAKRGGMVNFYLRDARVRFEINPEACRRAKLRLSAKLLKLARIVEDEKR